MYPKCVEHSRGFYKYFLNIWTDTNVTNKNWEGKEPEELEASISVQIPPISHLGINILSHILVNQKIQSKHII